MGFRLLPALFAGLCFVSAASVFGATLPDPVIVMAGDSLTEQGNWSVHFPTAHAITRATGGFTIDDVLARVSSITELKPARVFLMLGVNDLVRGDSPQDAFGRYRQLLHALESTVVFVQSTLPCDVTKRNPVVGDGCPALNKKIGELNALLSSAAGPRVTFVDLTDTMANANGLRPEFSSDGVHLTAAGYAAWRDTIRPFVEPSTPDKKDPRARYIQSEGADIE